jgi:hypothetical protein
VKIDFHAAYSQTVPNKVRDKLTLDEGKFEETLGEMLHLSSPKEAENLAKNIVKSNSYIKEQGIDKSVGISHLDELPTPHSQLFEDSTATYLKLKNEDAAVKTSTNTGDISDKKAPDELSLSSIKSTSSPREKISRAEIEELIRGHAMQNGVDPLLGISIVASESSFNPAAVSQDGHESKGLFQLLDSTGRELKAQLKESFTTVDEYNPFEPKENVELGINYLRKLHDYFGKETTLHDGLMTYQAANASSLEELAVAAFNAGEGRVAQAQAKAKAAGREPGEFEEVARYLPETTVDYVKKVISYRNQIERTTFDHIAQKL